MVEVAGLRDICQAVLTAIFPSGVLHVDSSSVFLNHYRTLRTSINKDTWIQSVLIPKTMPSRKHNQLKRSDRWYIVAAALAAGSYIFLMKRLYFAFVGGPSYSLVLD